jgi:hypothetical protein
MKETKGRIQPIPPDDIYHVVLRQAAEVFLKDGVEAGRKVLDSIAGEVWVKSLSAAPRRGTARVQRSVGDGSRAVTTAHRAATLVRDHFRCRYCGTEVLPKSVAFLMSSIYPVELPFHAHYKRGEIHPLYWTRVAELDHLVPGSRSQEWLNPANHVTACVACNTIKGDRTPSELGWEVLPRATSDWDGMVGLYGKIWVEADRPGGMPHSEWLKCFRSAMR